MWALTLGGVAIGLPAADARRAVFAEGAEAIRFAEDNRRVYAALRDAARVVVRARAESSVDWVRALWWPHANGQRVLRIVRAADPEFEQLRAIGFTGVDLADRSNDDDPDLGEPLAPLEPAAFDDADQRLVDVISSGPTDPRFDSLVFERLEAKMRGPRGPWLRIVPSAGRFRVQFVLATGVVRWVAVKPDHGVFPVDAALAKWQALVAGLPPGAHRVWWRLDAADRGLHTRWRVLAFEVPPARR